MRIGWSSPNADYGVGPIEMARDLEARGYDSLWVGEHSHIPTSRETPHPSGIELPRFYSHMRNPFVSLGAAAAVTERLLLFTGVCLVLEHEIMDLTKSIATLDQVAGGRFRLGVGVGWNREELANVSAVPWSQRYRAMRETVQAMRALWAEDSAGFEGEFVRVVPSWVYPKPTRPGGPPVLLGCQGRVGIRHVAEYADEWCPIEIGFRDPARGVQRFRDAVVEAGRDPDTIPISLFCRKPLTPDSVQRYADLGITRLVVVGPDEVELHQGILERNQALVDECRTL
jgi:probable F420-dependent oxidoreductase